MFCYNCGTQIPDEASFCWKCGKPQKQGAKPAEEPKWETCEIWFTRRSRGFGGSALWFWAEAIGPNGKYSAGESSEFNPSLHFTDYPESDHPAAIAALNGLVAKLTKDGWEPLGRGQYWYSHTFRRRAGTRTQISPEDPLTEHIKELLRKGQKIPAIKFYRESTHGKIGLKEAKDFVEEIEKHMKGR